jgi:hypothetical protein
VKTLGLKLWNWFHSKSPGKRAGMTMGCGCLTIILIFLIGWMLVAWLGAYLFTLIPIALAIYLIAKVCQGIHFVWRYLASEFAEGDNRE